MNSKLNIEEIRLLIPDYITGELNEADKSHVEQGLTEFPELKQFYNEMKDTLHFVSSVKFTEPAPRYWNTLLPRIHEKIESREAKGFSWEKISVLWKVIVPVAAVLLIALVYYVVKPSNTQFTEEKKIENIIKDKKPEEIIKDKQDIKQENKPENNIVKENENRLTPEDNQKPVKKNTIEYKYEIVKDDVNTNDSKKENEKVNEEQYALDDDIEETSVFATGEGAGLDEETINELKKLDDNEQTRLLEELINSNL